MTSSVALAAAHDTTLPPYVPPCVPGFQAAMSSARARIPDSGSPDAMPLAMTRMSGSTSQCWTANISPVRPNPVWTSSAMSRMPCWRVISRSRGRKPGGGTT